MLSHPVLHAIVLAALFHDGAGQTQTQFTIEPRWGQASLLLQDTLFLHGGHSAAAASGGSYTSTPINRDLITLDLALPFDATQPPWALVNSPSLNASDVLGPPVAWHTINAFNSSHALVFGGFVDFNGQPPTPGQPDSAGILDAFDRSAPVFSMQPSGWDSEPIRRLHHAAVTTPDGRIWIFGGEKADLSNVAYSDNYVFDPSNGGLFTPIPGSTLPDLTGECAVVLPDSRILILGGFSPSQNKLIDFSTITILTTSSWPPSWSQFTTSGGPPGGRRNFACTLYGPDKIYIQGGSDGPHQTIFSDGWVLDLSQSTPVWSQVPALSQVGNRSDHFAIVSGNEIIFGFGYGSSQPAGTPLQIFNPTGAGNGGQGQDQGGTFSGSHTPPSSQPSSPANPSPGSGGSPSQTVPGASGTPKPGSGGSTDSGAVHPTSTQGSGGNGNQPADPRTTSRRTTAIAVGTAIGLCALIAGGAVVGHRVRKRRRVRRQFMALSGGDDDEENRPPLLVASSNEKSSRRTRYGEDPTTTGLGGDIIYAMGLPHIMQAVHNLPGVAGRARNPREVAERRDMLADEDNISFRAWYDARRQDGTGVSSWSLRSILAGGASRSRKDLSQPPTPGGRWDGVTAFGEKADPFSDGAALLRDGATGAAVAASAALPVGSRPRPQRKGSSFSTISYTDPFADPVREDLSFIREGGGSPALDTYVHRDVGRPIREHTRGQSVSTFTTTSGLGHSRGNTSDSEAGGSEYGSEPLRPHRRPLQPPPTLTTILPFETEGHALSPLTESSSRQTLTNSSQSHSSMDKDRNPSPFDTLSSSHHTSLTSINPASPTPSSQSHYFSSQPTSILAPNRTSSIIDSQPREPMRRSNSWWHRFSRTSLLDRQNSGSRRTPQRQDGAFEFRDPNPPPMNSRFGTLGAIEETSTHHSGSPDESPPSVTRRSSSKRAQDRIIGSGTGKGSLHGKSMSSLKTVDSDALERVGMGGMDVVQRVATRESSGSSHLRFGSSYSQESGDPRTNEHGYLDDEFAQIVSSPTEIPASDIPLPESVYAPSTVAKSNSIPSVVPTIPSEHMSSAKSSQKSLLVASPEGTPSPQSSAQSLAQTTSSATHDTFGRPKTNRQESAGAVAARIQAFEKRASQALDPSPPPTNTRSREEKTRRGSKTTYEIVPRATIFITNPDKKKEGSGDSA